RLGPGFGGAWSPDGRRIAFERNDGVYVMDRDGRHSHKVTVERYQTGAPAWSPDGTRLAYVACTAPFLSRPCEHQYGFDVYTIRVDGHGKRRITRHSAYPQCPAWSSAGVLAFDADQQVAIFQRRTGRLRTFRPGGCPVFGPGGRRLVVTASTGIAFLNSNGGG